MNIVQSGSSSKGIVMLTERDLRSHDDYENFAKYLGIDYDTYLEMTLGIVPSEDEDFELVGISNAYQSR